MDSNGQMTGQLNQQNRPSVFAFNPYQQQNMSAVDNWAKLQGSPALCPGQPFQNAPSNPQFSNIGQQLDLMQQMPPQLNYQTQPFLDNYTPSNAPLIANSYGVPGPIPGSFSFGSVPANQSSFPVQFPFPTNTPVNVNDINAGAGPSGLSAGSSIPGKPQGPKLAPGSFFHNANTEMNITSRPTSSCDMSDTFIVPMRGKRKCREPPLRPLKQHITEEVMAEHMSNLHISSESEVPNETDTKREKRLYMCAEMRKLQTDSILPQSLLDNMNRPCTALVLWTPPPRIFPPLYGSSGSSEGMQPQGEDKAVVSSRMDNESSTEEITIEEEGSGSAVATEMDFDL